MTPPFIMVLISTLCMIISWSSFSLVSSLLNLSRSSSCNFVDTIASLWMLCIRILCIESFLQLFIASSIAYILNQSKAFSAKFKCRSTWYLLDFFNWSFLTVVLYSHWETAYSTGLYESIKICMAIETISFRHNRNWKKRKQFHWCIFSSSLHQTCILRRFFKQI